jgi:hypothetical protein
MIFNIITLPMSVAALAVSSWTAVRQINRTRAASDLTMTTDFLINHVRNPEFQRDQRFVLFELGQSHSPDQGIEQLPDPVNFTVWNVALIYQTVSIMMRCDTAERRIRQAPLFPFFEDAYLTACRTDPVDIYRRMGLQSSRPWTSPWTP